MTTPPPTQFRTQIELIDYLGAMERRVAMLEQENEQQQQAIDGLYHQQPQATAAAELPDTDLLSNNYLTRAFAVWGHEFVASLIIAIGLGIVAVVIYLIFTALNAAGV